MGFMMTVKDEFPLKIEHIWMKGPKIQECESLI